MGRGPSFNATRMAFDVIADAQAANTVGELEATAGHALRSYGFDVVTAVEISRRGNERTVQPLFGDVAAAPMLHYLDRGHGAYCPVVQAASSEPTIWTDLRARPLAKRQLLVLEELRAFGLNNGHI